MKVAIGVEGILDISHAKSSFSLKIQYFQEIYIYPNFLDFNEKVRKRIYYLGNEFGIEKVELINELAQFELEDWPVGKVLMDIKLDNFPIKKINPTMSYRMISEVN